METLAIAAAYAAYEKTHKVEPIIIDFSAFKLFSNAQCLAYIGVLLLGSQFTLGSGAIAGSTMLSQPLENGIVNTNSDCLRVRVVPHGEVVGCLSRGTHLAPIIREDNGWYQLTTGNWVSKDFVALLPSAPNTKPTSIQYPWGQSNVSFETEELKYIADDPMRGDVIVKLQTELNYYKLLADPVKVDGVFGEKTMLAVMVFQQQKGLNTNGIVGGATREALRM